MAGEISLHQFWQTPVITRVVSRVKTPLRLLSQFYKLRPGDPATQTSPSRHVGWDVFNAQRSPAKGRPPGSGPATVNRKPVGHISAQTFRTFEKIPILDEEIYRLRPLGGQIGSIDTRGQGYVAKQAAWLKSRAEITREFMVSRMFRGGFGVNLDGEDWILVERDSADATFTVDYQLPNSHKDQLAVGGAAGNENIITDPWNDPSADLVTQFNNLDKASERESGYPARHVWINGTTAAYLINNTALQAVGGTAFRTFESLTAREMRSEEGRPDTGYDVVFRGLPLHTFHVYNGVLTVGFPGSLSESDTISASNNSLFIPDGKAIITPSPDPDWIGGIEAAEVVRENVLDQGKVVTGFHSWTTPIIDPPGRELKMLDNFLPVMYVPRAVYYGTVVF